MKKCPSCDKTFDDSMRFCQVDGTPLVEDVPEFDPYATIVAPSHSRREPVEPIAEPDPVPETPIIEIAPEPVEIAIEPAVVAPEPAETAFAPVEADPVIHQTVGSEPISEPEEVLDIPADPLKTMFVSEDEMQAALAGLSGNANEPEVLEIAEVEGPSAPTPPSFIAPDLQEPVIETAPPASPFSVPEPIEPEPVTETPPQEEPEPMSFNEAATMIQPSFDVPSAPPSFEPDPLPVYSTPEPEIEATPASPFSSPSAFEEPQAASPSPLGFDPPPPAPMDEWTPPPAPEPSWQNKEIGANTPFQSPQAGAAGPSSVLAIISLVLAVVGMLAAIFTLLFSLVPLTIVICGIPPFLLGVAAAITGFLARSRAKSMPEKYSGGGIAMGGLILGVLDIIAPFVIAGLWVLLYGGLSLLS